jgi:hypothetical protein
MFIARFTQLHMSPDNVAKIKARFRALYVLPELIATPVLHHKIALLNIAQR